MDQDVKDKWLLWVLAVVYTVAWFLPDLQRMLLP